jgi:Uma2 family endonuclease
MPLAAKYRIGFEDFCSLVNEGQKADLIDGVIYMASPDNVEHYDIFAWFMRLLNDYLEETNCGGRVFGSRVAFRLDDENAPEPDLAYVRPQREDLIQKTRIVGAPDWVLEIVSPESGERDYKRKRRQYEKFGVSEYWIIDPLQQRLTMYRLSRDGKLEEVRPRAGVAVSRVIRGFWVRTSWFWQTPLPSKSQALAEILKSRSDGDS